jgi:hypothetical protein
MGIDDKAITKACQAAGARLKAKRQMTEPSISDSLLAANQPARKPRGLRRPQFARIRVLVPLRSLDLSTVGDIFITVSA